MTHSKPLPTREKGAAWLSSSLNIVVSKRSHKMFGLHSDEGVPPPPRPRSDHKGDTHPIHLRRVNEGAEGPCLPIVGSRRLSGIPSKCQICPTPLAQARRRGDGRDFSQLILYGPHWDSYTHAHLFRPFLFSFLNSHGQMGFGCVH